MPVDARDVPASSTLAIVATLASFALLSFSLRLCTRGRRLRSLGSDDWLLIVAASCVIGDLVIAILLSIDKQAWSTTTGDQMPILIWVVTLVQTLGIGLIKLSVALTVQKLPIPSWHRHVVLGYVCLTTGLTVLWFGSALLFAGPITIDWSATGEPDAIRRLLGFINSVLDVATDAIVALLPLPLLWILRPESSVKLTLLAVYLFTTAAVGAASARTYLLYTTWQGESAHSSPLTTLCSSIELGAGMLAASLLTLPASLSSLDHRRRSSKQSTSTDTSPPCYPSETYASTSTVIHRPSAPHLLTLRFHDTESNIDFDMETPATRTRTHTLRSRTTHCHSRNVSDWSQFSGFTHYTTPAASAHGLSPRASRGVSMSGVSMNGVSMNGVGMNGVSSNGDSSNRVSMNRVSMNGASMHEASTNEVSMNEMERRTRSIGIGRAGADKTQIGIAVTTLHDKPVRDSEAGEEMAELARLFADQTQLWGQKSQ